MDEAKCEALKRALSAQPEPQVVPVARFFDGNDDVGSIGCNLLDHPGVEMFRDILVGLTQRPDVEAVYAEISELDPGETSWPFTDTILVVGTISSDDLQEALAGLKPDDVWLAESDRVPAAILERHRSQVLIAWWD